MQCFFCKAKITLCMASNLLVSEPLRLTVKPPPRVMKKFVIFLLVMEIAAAFLVGSSGCFLRHDAVRAFAAWHDHPSPETKAELDRQKRITQFENLGLSGALFCGMAGV